MNTSLLNNCTDFNINEYVYVKLTDYGKTILKEKRKRFNEMLTSKGLKPLESNVVEIDDQGYSKFQLWELMNTFGNFIDVHHQLPFETNIKFDKTYK